MSPLHLLHPNAWLNRLGVNLTTEEDDCLGEILESNAVIEWHRFKADDERTWPHAHSRDDTVLGLTVWTKGASHRYGSMASGRSRQAVFFEAHFGRYDWIYRNGQRDECVFFLDHGDHDEDDMDSYVSPPKWWTFISDPQALDLEGVE